MTSEVSRILWLYYNDRVCAFRLLCVAQRLKQRVANSLPRLRWKRAVLRRIISCQVVVFAHRLSVRTGHPLARCWSQLGRRHCLRDVPCVLHQEHHQCRPAVEGLENTGWRGLGRARQGKAGQAGEELAAWAFL